MSDSSKDDEVFAAVAKAMLRKIHVGTRLSIWAYRTSDTECPALEFLEELKGAKVQQMRIAAKSYGVSFKRVGAGENVRGEQWRTWKDHDSLGEYKHIGSKTRILHLSDGRRHILLFGFGGKKENKVKNEYVTRAESLRDEYFERRAEIEKKMKKGGGA